eukprot:TRINITY_DN38220_c0_g1_i2.p1 TRINITY_DN38220_c0_g1~~TRINITY_DN38220_c0_g1_i2.p1  ORF type:complete len:155 (+),score=20.86 TRINITY_DN38220_c0_g1_i2:53-466(+)
MDPKGEIKVKGKNLMITIFEPKELARAVELMPDNPSKQQMLGRETEMTLLSDTIKGLKSGLTRSKLILFEGPAGMGKSTLMKSFYRQLKQENTVPAYYICADATEKRRAFSIWTPLLEIGRAVQQECRDRSRMPSSA